MSEREDASDSKEGARASEEKWERLLARPESKRALREMASEALADHRAGRTTEIAVTEDGRLAPA
jgi:hypothetical protein